MMKNEKEINSPRQLVSDQVRSVKSERERERESERKHRYHHADIKHLRTWLKAKRKTRRWLNTISRLVP